MGTVALCRHFFPIHDKLWELWVWNRWLYDKQLQQFPGTVVQQVEYESIWPYHLSWGLSHVQYIRVPQHPKLSGCNLHHPRLFHKSPHGRRERHFRFDFFWGKGMDFNWCTKNAERPWMWKKKSKVKIIIMHRYTGVSKNGGTPKSSILNKVFHDKPSILGYHYFRKHPCTSINYIPNYDLGTIGVRFFITCFKRETSGVLWKSFQWCGIGVYVRFANVDVDEDGI